MSHDSPMAEAVASNEVTAAEIEEVSPSSTDFNGGELMDCCTDDAFFDTVEEL